jgi:hypothetical protein
VKRKIVSIQRLVGFATFLSLFHYLFLNFTFYTLCVCPHKDSKTRTFFSVPMRKNTNLGLGIVLKVS